MYSVIDPKVALLDGFDNLTIMVSVASVTESSTTPNVIDLEVTPGSKTKVPPLNKKSAPLDAVPPATK